jgi:hypothetical protein
VGSAQGIIIASIFFGFATLQTFATYQAIAQGSVLESTDLRAGGWSLFALLVIGSIAAASGGAMGSRQNARKPLSREIYASRSEMEPAHV